MNFHENSGDKYRLRNDNMGVTVEFSRKFKAYGHDKTKLALVKSGVSVSALCQPVSPFKTLHALYLSGLCQRVSLI